VNGYDFVSAPKIPGDGRLPFMFATPTSGIPYNMYKSKKSHMDLLNIKKIPLILNDLLTAAQQQQSKL